LRAEVHPEDALEVSECGFGVGGWVWGGCG
jgi:hypothetical protein